jgi:hypothetical protein
MCVLFVCMCVLYVCMCVCVYDVYGTCMSYRCVGRASCGGERSTVPDLPHSGFNRYFSIIKLGLIGILV